MASKETVQGALAAKQRAQLDVLILLLCVDGVDGASTGELIQIGTELGVRNIGRWSISTVLSRGRQYVMRVSKGWSLTNLGHDKARMLCGEQRAPKCATRLSSYIEGLPEGTTKQFLAEALTCFETGCMRAATIMTWVGAMSVLYKHVLDDHLAAFNEAAAKRNPKSKRVVSYDDMANIRESEFLEIACSASVIGKSVKKELEACLDFRNGCSHPNSLIATPSRVESFIETLIANVFQRYSDVK